MVRDVLVLLLVHLVHLVHLVLHVLVMGGKYSQILVLQTGTGLSDLDSLWMLDDKNMNVYN